MSYSQLRKGSPIPKQPGSNSRSHCERSHTNANHAEGIQFRKIIKYVHPIMLIHISCAVTFFARAEGTLAEPRPSARGRCYTVPRSKSLLRPRWLFMHSTQSGRYEHITQYTMPQ